jgi:hypothetical protein
MSQDRIDIRQAPYTSVVLHPPADEQAAAPTGGKTARPGPGAGGSYPSPQPAGPEPKTIPSSPDTAKSAAEAENAAHELAEAAKAYIELLKRPAAWPAQLYDASRRLETAQNAARTNESVDERAALERALSSLTPAEANTLAWPAQLYDASRRLGAAQNAARTNESVDERAAPNNDTLHTLERAQFAHSSGGQYSGPHNFRRL